MTETPLPTKATFRDLQMYLNATELTVNPAQNIGTARLVGIIVGDRESELFVCTDMTRVLNLAILSVPIICTTYPRDGNGNFHYRFRSNSLHSIA